MNLRSQIVAWVLVAAVVVTPASALMNACARCEGPQRAAAASMPCCPDAMQGPTVDPDGNWVQPSQHDMSCCTVSIAPEPIATFDPSVTAMAIAPVMPEAERASSPQVKRTGDAPPHGSPPLAVLCTLLI